MKIYTKTGDKGETSLLGGTRVPKYHLRIETYGTVDELNSFIGLLNAYKIRNKDKLILSKIQNLLFTIGANLAMDDQNKDFGLPKVTKEDIVLLEQEMDRMNAELPKLKAFIIPGGDKVVAMSHICRSICRRAERLCTQLFETETVDEKILIFFNRLSDYFFMLGRKIAFERKIKIPEWDGGKIN